MLEAMRCERMLSFSHGFVAAAPPFKHFVVVSRRPFSVNFLLSIGLMKSDGPLLSCFMPGALVCSPVGSHLEAVRSSDELVCSLL